MFSVLPHRSEKMSAILNIEGGIEESVGDTDRILLIPQQDLPLFRALKLDTHGGIIAGGAARRWYEGRRATADVGDIDLWFEHSHAFDTAYEIITSIGHAALVHHSERAISIRFDQGTKEVPDLADYSIQLIHSIKFPSIQELFRYFDITVCKVAVDGRQWYFDDNFIQDHRRRVLRFSHHNHDSVVNRLIKYWNLGFEPSDETIQRIIDDPGISWDLKNKDQDY